MTTATILRGNALHLPLADNTIDLICTSPPYFGLRSYTDGGEHYPGQLGAEATPAEFVDALIAATAEMVRVLKPSGSIFVNLGDKMCADNRGSSRDAKRGDAKWAPAGPAGYPGEGIIPRKSLMGIPWRYALRCIDDLGLILRAEIIWAKPNGLPESVTDRVRRSHETWFHLVKEPRYYSAVDEIREAYTLPQSAWGHTRGATVAYDASRSTGYEHNESKTANPLGKLPSSVWTIPTQPLTVPAHLGVDHFAAFPMEWPRRIITGWSPREVCTACGEGRRPVAERASMERHNNGRYAYQPYSPDNKHGTGAHTLGYVPDYRITGYVCACTPWHMEPTPTYDDPDNEVLVYDWAQWTPAPATPGTVLDPFGGTGTTALVAKVLGRNGISIDMSADYNRLATWRTNDPDQIAAAMQVDKPVKQVDGQTDLFELLGEGL